MEKNKKQGGLIAVAVVALVAVLMAAAWFLLKPPAQAGGKTIQMCIRDRAKAARSAAPLRSCAPSSTRWNRPITWASAWTPATCGTRAMIS